VERYALGKVRVCRGWGSQMEQGRSQGTVCRHAHRGVLGLLCQGQELLAQFVCRLVLGAYEIKVPESTQYREKLLRLGEVLTELSSTRVRLSSFRGCLTFRGKQRCAQSDQHVYFTLETLRGLG